MGGSLPQHGNFFCLSMCHLIDVCYSNEEESILEMGEAGWNWRGDTVMHIKAKYTTLIVEDLEESVAFYRDVLGFREGYQVNTGAGGRITVMDSDLASVERIENKVFPTGMYSIGTDVDDLQEVITHLKARGVELESPVLETSVGHMVFVKDPNGVRICLIEHDKKI